MNHIKYNPLPELIPQEIIERASKLSPAQLCDGMIGLGIIRDGCMDADIMPISEGACMIGTACTAATENGDNFPIHIAIYQSGPGYVLIVDGKGYRESTYMGDLMGSAADAIGLNGIVIDGYVRDKQGLKALSMPVYAKGIMQRGPQKKGPGEINTIISCAGVKVEPGDLVFGDTDGVTVVPRDRILEVLENAEKKDAYEIKRRAAIAEYRRCRTAGEKLPELAPDWALEKLEVLKTKGGL